MFERYDDQQTAASIAKEQKKAELRAEKARLQTQLRAETDGRNPRIDEDLVKHLEEAIADVNGQLRAADEAFETNPVRKVPGLSWVNDALRQRTGKLASRNTTDEAIEGKTDEEMMDLWRSKIVELDYHVEGLYQRPVSRELMEKQIEKGVAALDKAKINVGAVRHVRPRGLRKRVAQGPVEWPKTFDNGIEVVDLAATLFAVPAIRKQLTKFLVEQALIGHDENQAMTDLEREEAVAAAREEQREARYKAAYWYRKLLARGVFVSVPTSDVLALLDVE